MKSAGFYPAVARAKERIAISGKYCLLTGIDVELNGEHSGGAYASQIQSEILVSI
jgi:hypothetical protein